MGKQYGKALCAAFFATVILVSGLATAQATNELIITSFQDGYLSWTNGNSNLYYTVEYKPNLNETNLAWNGSYRVSQDVRSSSNNITVPVGVYYQVVGSSNPLHTLTLSPTSGAVAAGYYAATTLSAVDANLSAANIATNVTVFGIAGTLNTNVLALVPKTGQTNSYQTGDDGTYKKGVAWPNPRFTIGTGVDGTNCVTDNLTGLMWTRNANLGGTKTWTNAIAYCEALTNGVYTDWRLPNKRELLSLTDDGQKDPVICNTAGTGKWSANDPFTGVQSSYYWSSTSYAGVTPTIWCVWLGQGDVLLYARENTFFVWPVRGGQ